MSGWAPALTKSSQPGIVNAMKIPQTLRYVSVFMLALALNASYKCAEAKPSVTQSHTPHRIISLLPSITEMLYALKCDKRMVADTTYCDFPPAARKLPKIGDLNVNYERLLALHPDLVAADSVANRSSIAKLRSLKVPLVVISSTNYTEVLHALRVLGRATGTLPQANRVVEHMTNQRRQAAFIVARDKSSAPRVLAVVGVSPLWVAGRSTFIDDLIRLAGGINVARNSDGYGSLSKELLLTLRPNVIVGSSNDIDSLSKDPIVNYLPAYKNHRMIVFPNPDILSRPGPRLGDALLILTNLLHPNVRR